MLVADTRAIVARGIPVERVPLLDCGHLEPLEEGRTDGYRKRENHMEELILGRIQVAIDVEQENHVDKRDVFRAVFN